MGKMLMAFDVDTDALADTLERMADGVRSGDIGIKRVNTDHDARIDDASEFGFSMTFVTSHEFADVVDGIEYETDDGGDE